VEREAFLRARRFLDYSPLAKWTALIAAIGSGVLYVALLVILGLFTDLVISRGNIPAFGDLSLSNREAFRQDWKSLPPDEQLNLLQAIGVPARDIEGLEPAVREGNLEQQDVLWLAEVRHVLEQQVSEAAGSVIGTAARQSALSNRGLLSLAVRSYPHTYGRVVSLVARPHWTWDNNRALLALFLLAVGLAVLRALTRFLMTIMAARATAEAATRLRRAVYHHTYRLGTLAVRALGPSEAVGIFTRELEAVQNGLYAWLTVVFREPVKFALLLIFALAINPVLTFAFICFALFVWLVGRHVEGYYRRQGKAANQKAAEQLALIQESLMLMRLVRVYLMELFNQSRVERQLASYQKAQMRRHWGEAVYRPLVVLLGTLAAAGLLFAAGKLVIQGSLALATAITLATALISLYWPVENWWEHRRLLRRARASAVALFEFLDRRGEVGQMVGAEFLPPLAAQLEFDEVSLIEPGTDRLLLKGVNFSIQAGQRIGLVGADELEKHALVYLIPRFLDPNNGEIRIDGRNLRWVTLDSLRAQIAIVMQHNLIFNDTVANNIGCGDSSYTLPQIIEAAKVAHAHQFIQKLPRGYETLIGEMGHLLPIGHQFLIALARAILRDPALLIIEEPLTPLEDDIKALLDDTFARVLPGRTVIFLPHRIPTIRSCDQIFLIHKGSVNAAGEHRELLSQNELYRHLHYIEFHELAEQL
jgi:ATP-binding cassette, subfamily B, bacterial